MIEMRSSTMEDAARMAPLLRDMDRFEIEALTGEEPETALLQGLSGDVCLTGLVDDEPILMTGVAAGDLDRSFGYVWLLGSDRIENHSIQFLREGPRYLEAMLDLYPALTNIIHKDNKVHLRWLKWMGFHFLDGTPAGAPPDFLQFVRYA